MLARLARARSRLAVADLREERLRVAQIAGLEAFAEPAEEAREELPRSRAVAATPQKASEAHRGAKLEHARALPSRDRALIRLHYVDGVGLERIGTIYGVHKATVSRWLAAAREQLLYAAIGAVQAEAGGDTDEVASLCAFLRSNLELSMSALYGTGSRDRGALPG